MPSYSAVTLARTTVDVLGWDALIAPATTSRVELENLGPADVRYRTVADDSTTEVLIPVGGIRTLAPYRQAAWRNGDEIGALQAVGDTTTVLVTWVA